METFAEWLLRKGYITSTDTVQNELSACELDYLYDIYFNETGGEDNASLF
jgi:hypothetical protein